MKPAPESGPPDLPFGPALRMADVCLRSRRRLLPTSGAVARGAGLADGARRPGAADARRPAPSPTRLDGRRAPAETGPTSTSSRCRVRPWRRRRRSAPSARPRVPCHMTDGTPTCEVCGQPVTVDDLPRVVVHAGAAPHAVSQLHSRPRSGPSTDVQQHSDLHRWTVADPHEPRRRNLQSPVQRFDSARRLQVFPQVRAGLWGVRH